MLQIKQGLLVFTKMYRHLVVTLCEEIFEGQLKSLGCVRTMLGRVLVCSREQTDWHGSKFCKFKFFSWKQYLEISFS